MERFFEPIYDCLMKGYRATEKAAQEVLDTWEVILSVLWVVAKVAACLCITVYAQVMTLLLVYGFLTHDELPAGTFFARFPIVGAFIAVAIGESVVVVSVYGVFYSLFSFRLILHEESRPPDRFNPIDDNEVDTVDPLQF